MTTTTTKPTKLGACLIALLAPSLATADSFEARAQSALRTRPDDIVWALTAPCDKGDEVQQRQCRIIRDRKARALMGTTLWIDGDREALQVGAWSAAKKSVDVNLSSCVRCDGVGIDGQTWFVMGTGSPRMAGNKLRAPVLYDNARQFPDEAAADGWTKAMARAKFQLLVKVPTEVTKRRFIVSGKEGFALEVVAWRVLHACDGSVVISSLPSGPIEPDKSQCVTSGGIVIPPDASADSLTPAMVSDAMRPVVAAARACFLKFRMSGRAKLEITILADGSVEKYTQKGDFDGSPTAKCIDDAMAKVSFPKTKKPSTKIGFPILLN